MSSPSEKDARQAEYFSNRLLKNHKNLRKWARKEDIHALRLYDRDIPEVPLAVDLYGEGEEATLLIALYERPYEKDEVEENSLARPHGGNRGRRLENRPGKDTISKPAGI